MIEICTRNRLSVFISLILRHKPEAAGTILDKHSLADVKELLAGIRETGLRIGMEELVWIVAAYEKHRYSFNEDNTLICINQGYSIPVDVELPEADPPEVLYHGTAVSLLEAIRKSGRQKTMSKLCVHLLKAYL